MAKISQMQIEEILDEGYELRLSNSERYEGRVVASLVNLKSGLQADAEIGTDIGELVNELHSRL